MLVDKIVEWGITCKFIDLQPKILSIFASQSQVF